MRHWTAALLVMSLALPLSAGAAAPPPGIEAAAVVLMEQETGQLLCEENAQVQREPASVTKVMTLLLVMEAIADGRLTMEDQVTVSAAAADMGGSQVYLKEGERFSVRELLKTVAVVSANDGAVALAEHLAGSEEAFVAKMNTRAAELGMEQTVFQNCTGLPAQGHLTTAYDVAIMSRALLAHAAIREFTTIWIDSIRDGAFQLANTNKLIRFYDGATGLKTGSTDGALYCLSATAERDGMELIAVVLGSPTSERRFEGAKALLNYGFANYTLLEVYPDSALAPVPVVLGEQSWVQPVPQRAGRILVDRAQAGEVERTLTLAENVEAPVEAGQKLGELTITLGGVTKEVVDIVAAEPVARLGFGGVLSRLLALIFLAPGAG